MRTLNKYLHSPPHTAMTGRHHIHVLVLVQRAPCRNHIRLRSSRHAWYLLLIFSPTRPPIESLTICLSVSWAAPAVTATTPSIHRSVINDRSFIIYRTDNWPAITNYEHQLHKSFNFRNAFFASVVHFVLVIQDVIHVTWKCIDRVLIQLRVVPH